MTIAKRRFLATSLLIALFFSFSIMAGAATAKIIQIWPYDCVDNGKHCDWDANQSKYQSYVVTGTNKWNAYKPGVFRPDSISVVQDVRISDVNKSGVVWAGETNFGLGTIQLNTYYLDSSAWSNHRLIAIMHELGHALGLDENAATGTNIMYPSLHTNTNATLTADDKASYDAAYARY